jgi:hypothetical protein
LNQRSAFSLFPLILLQHLVIFAGGDSDATFRGLKKTVDIYDAVLKTFTRRDLSVARSNLAAVSLPNLGLAFFAGGYSGLGSFSNVVDVFNASSRSFMPGEILHLDFVEIYNPSRLLMHK